MITMLAISSVVAILTLPLSPMSLDAASALEGQHRGLDRLGAISMPRPTSVRT